MQAQQRLTQRPADCNLAPRFVTRLADFTGVVTGIETDGTLHVISRSAWHSLLMYSAQQPIMQSHVGYWHSDPAVDFYGKFDRSENAGSHPQQRASSAGMHTAVWSCPDLHRSQGEAGAEQG